MLLKGLNSTRQAISLDNMGLDRDQDELSLTQLAKVVALSFSEKRNAKVKAVYADKAQDQALPRVITFPYSRHSSYAELCDLVRVFKPKDVYPCTVDEDNWHEGLSLLPKWSMNLVNQH
jgi:DNA cross-link repair 1C protein